jgi:hypothetical protein
MRRATRPNKAKAQTYEAEAGAGAGGHRIHQHHPVCDFETGLGIVIVPKATHPLDQKSLASYLAIGAVRTAALPWLATTKVVGAIRCGTQSVAHRTHATDDPRVHAERDHQHVAEEEAMTAEGVVITPTHALLAATSMNRPTHNLPHPTVAAVQVTADPTVKAHVSFGRAAAAGDLPLRQTVKRAVVRPDRGMAMTGAVDRAAEQAVVGPWLEECATQSGQREAHLRETRDMVDESARRGEGAAVEAIWKAAVVGANEDALRWMKEDTRTVGRGEEGNIEGYRLLNRGSMVLGKCMGKGVHLPAFTRTRA